MVLQDEMVNRVFTTRMMASHVQNQGRVSICPSSTLKQNRSINERTTCPVMVHTVRPGILFGRPVLKEKAARALEDEVALDSSKTLELSGEVVG